MTTKLDISQASQSPAPVQGPATTLPEADNTALERDVKLFEQSMSEAAPEAIAGRTSGLHSRSVSSLFARTSTKLKPDNFAATRRVTGQSVREAVAEHSQTAPSEERSVFNPGRAVADNEPQPEATRVEVPDASQEAIAQPARSATAKPGYGTHSEKQAASNPVQAASKNNNHQLDQAQQKVADGPQEAVAQPARSATAKPGHGANSEKQAASNPVQAASKNNKHQLDQAQQKVADGPQEAVARPARGTVSKHGKTMKSGARTAADAGQTVAENNKHQPAPTRPEVANGSQEAVTQPAHGTVEAHGQDAQSGGQTEPTSGQTVPENARRQLGAPRSEASTTEKTERAEAEPADEAHHDLHELLTAQRAHSQEIAAQQAGKTDTPGISPELVNDVAQRILVSAGHGGQDKEVRIRIKDTVLQHTEVAIKHDKGALVVSFVTQSANDNALLNNHRSAISTALKKSLSGNIRVEVRADNDSGDHGNRRSRGLYLNEEEDM